MYDKTELLLNWFHSNRARLQEWLAQSDRNQRWFVNDPLAAITAAGVALDDDLVAELESAARVLSQLLNPKRAIWSAGYRYSA